MGELVAGISMSHAPGLLGWPDAPPKEVRDNIGLAMKELAARLERARPDVIVAFLDDHFDNHFRNLMPTFAVGVADSHTGPGRQYRDLLKMETAEIPSNGALGETILRGLVDRNFDIARMGKVEYGNNLMVPLKFIRPSFDIPVVPIFINVFSPPLPSMDRAYSLGEAVRDIVSRGSERVMVLGTGGLSHWPPIWNDRSPADDVFLRRMKRYQTEGKTVLHEDPDLLSDLGDYEIEMADQASHPLVNGEWDRRFLCLLEEGDAVAVRALTYEEIETQAGHGGHEVLNWAAVMGAMGGRRGDYVCYEPVGEWICGMGFVGYDAQS